MSILGDLFGTGRQTNTTTSTPQVPADVAAARQDLLARARAFAAEPYTPYVMRRPSAEPFPGTGPRTQGPGTGGAPMIMPSGEKVLPDRPTTPFPSQGRVMEAGILPLPTQVGGGATGQDSYVGIPRVAGFTPDQLAGFQATRDIAGAAGALAPLTPELTREGIAATRGLAQRLPDVNIEEYMSPYTQAVLDPAIRDIEERAARQRLALGQQSARTGSFGGSRQAIAESELERGTQRTIGEESARLRNQAYNQALQQFREDQTRIPQLYAGALGQLGTGLAQTAGRLGVEAQPLINIGGAQQGLGQRNLDILRETFEEERDFPLRGIEVLRGALGLTPQTLGVGTAGTSSTPGPNVLGSVIGGLTQVPNVISGATALTDFFRSFGGGRGPANIVEGMF